MELTNTERKTLVESLIFALSADACLKTENFDAKTALELAVKFNDESVRLDCYLYQGSDIPGLEFYEEISHTVKEQIPQIEIQRS